MILGLQTAGFGCCKIIDRRRCWYARPSPLEMLRELSNAPYNVGYYFLAIP
jgi:hypothetical protein